MCTEAEESFTIAGSYLAVANKLMEDNQSERKTRCERTCSFS